MPTTAPVRPITADSLRQALAGDPFEMFAGEDLVDARADATDEAQRIIESNRGASLRASDQRRLDAATERVELIDKLRARQQDSIAAANAPRIRRAAIAASVRAASPGAFGDANHVPQSERFGTALRDAIGEVLEGRAASYVEAPIATRALLESGAAGQGVAMSFQDPVTTMNARSVVMSLPGLRTVPMQTDRARWPRIGGATVSGTAEGATLTAANTDTDSVDVVAVKFSTMETMSTELVEDYSADALAVFGDNLLRHLALRVDLGLLAGNGALDCVGIRNTVGANSTSVAATPANFAKFRDAEYELRLDNGEPAIWVMHPRAWKTLSGIKTGLASDETTLLEPNPQEGPRSLLGFPVAFSTQITLTEGAGAGSWAALLDTSQLLVAERRPARLEVSRDFKFDEDVIAVRATWRGNLVALNPEAISLLTDIRS